MRVERCVMTERDFESELHGNVVTLSVLQKQEKRTKLGCYSFRLDSSPFGTPVRELPFP